MTMPAPQIHEVRLYNSIDSIRGRVVEVHDTGNAVRYYLMDSYGDLLRGQVIMTECRDNDVVHDVILFLFAQEGRFPRVLGVLSRAAKRAEEDAA